MLMLATAVLLAVMVMRTRGFRRKCSLVAAAVAAVAAVVVWQQGTLKIHNPFAGLPEEQVLESILAGVLDQVNIAYLEKQADAVSQALEVVVAKENFPEVLKELDRALAIEVAGGGIARVESIEISSLKQVSPLETGSGFRTTAEWVAHASAGHWGHSHRRSIRFQALVELDQQAGEWKLEGITVIDTRDVSG
ncbi:MAG: hypothetical protein GY888_14165 [Planctomycetaceae bacterium]|nr:hypothetical protein [Planctomycetaceae bacterium]